MAKKVKIQDIADALGVSRNTVSKAINNSPGLAEETRQKILEKAVELGYKQFSYVKAGALSGEEQEKEPPGFRGEIALFTTQFLAQPHFASRMMDKFHRGLSELGYTLNTHRVRQRNLAGLTPPITFVPERTTAIVCFEIFDKAYADMVCALGLPVLFVDGPVKSYGDRLEADQLYMDNTSELSGFVHAVLQRGWRRIGFIGDYRHCESFFERYCAVRDTVMMEGLALEERFVLPYNDPGKLSQVLFSMEELPDIFFCANDFIAFEVMEALRSLGRRVPEDVMLCGFDDCAESRSCHPPLTTVHIHTDVMAEEALHLLSSRIREPGLEYRIVHTQSDLVERESTNRKGK